MKIIDSLFETVLALNKVSCHTTLVFLFINIGPIKLNNRSTLWSRFICRS